MLEADGPLAELQVHANGRPVETVVADIRALSHLVEPGSVETPDAGKPGEPGVVIATAGLWRGHGARFDSAANALQGRVVGMTPGNQRY